MNTGFENDLAEFVYYRTYSRWRDDLGRRENWDETVKRYIDFMNERVDFSQQEIEEITNAILNFRVMPSMRLMWSAGDAVRGNHIAAYNCAFLPIDGLGSFAEMMFILMHGTGVGFSVEKKYIEMIPSVAEKTSTEVSVVFEDSKEGWARGFLIVLQELFAGHSVQWDLSRIRQKGAVLKTFGGTASGQEPLDELLVFVKEIVMRHRGRKLSTINCLDIANKIAESIVVGGVRRSAQISLSDLHDDSIRHAKTGQFWKRNPQRALSNNSAVYEHPPSGIDFMREWLSLAESGSGERGIFNRDGAIKHLPARRKTADFGVNPCVIGETPLLTDKGHFPIQELVGQAVRIWNGEEWSEVEPFSTGINPLMKVELSDGSSLVCTPYHRWILQDGFNKTKQRITETKDLVVGDRLAKFEMPVIDCIAEIDNPTIDAYSQGFYSGDGLSSYNYSWVYHTKFCCESRLVGEIRQEATYGRKTWKHGEMLPKDFVPVNASIDFCLNWLAGILDSDGTVTRDKNGNGLQIGSVNKSFLLEIRLLLTRLGVTSKVVNLHSEGIKLMPDGRGGKKEYLCKESYRLLVNNMQTNKLINLGLSCSRLEIHDNPPQRSASQYVKIVGIEYLDDVAETFCVSEPKLNNCTFNGIVTKNCSEIILRPRQFCNLTEVVVRGNDDVGSLEEKCRIATILGTYQATLTDFGLLTELNPNWKKNCEDERLLGVSLTGIMDNAALLNANLLSQLRDIVLRKNEQYAEKFQINTAAATTCVKPSGTVSQLVNSASGCHARFSKHYIRRVRISRSSPLCKLMESQGIKLHPEIGQTTENANTLVAEFPVKSPENSVYDMDAITQLERWLLLKKHWAEHSISCTIYVDENEWFKVGAWVHKHFDEITGLSFLPRTKHVYQLAPYEAITAEQYDAMTVKMKEIDYSMLSNFEFNDQTIGAGELACTGGQCEI